MNNAPAPIDPTFIVQVQIAIIGIILVCGLFYIWRTVCRIEEKIDRMRSAPPPVPAPVPLQTMHFTPQQMCPMMGGYDDIEGDDDAAEALMKSVFGDVFTIHNPVGKASNASNTGVEVTEIEGDGESESEGYGKEKEPSADVDVIETADAEGEGEGEVETESVGGESIAVPGKLSKTKLKAMSVNMLKELCSQRGLSTEGAKPALIATLLAA